METDQLLMTQKERDRLVALKKAKKRLITQQQAASEIGVSERQVRRLLRELKERGDKAVIHSARGRRSNRRMAEEKREEAIQILSQEVYRGFGPTLAAEYLRKKHNLQVDRETLRGWMSAAQLWCAKPKRVEKVHTWRARRPRCGELVQWDTSEHAWLEGRGPKLYLISMIDDATSRLLARFVEHDSSQGESAPVAELSGEARKTAGLLTDKASLFATPLKTRRGELAGRDRIDLPPTQIGRALKELDIEWIAAHSPQAKGRIERGFGTAQDRLVKGLRVAGAKTLEQANAYLESECLPWWNQTLTVVPVSSDSAHRPVGLRGGTVRVEKRLDGTLAVRFRDRYLAIGLCAPCPKPRPQPAPKPYRQTARRKSNWMKNFQLGKNDVRGKTSIR